MALPSMRLDGKVALVTGAGGGIGSAVAAAYAEAGADCIVAEQPDRMADLDPVCEAIRGHGRRAEPLPLQLPDAASIDEHVREAMAVMGRIDILVNNAGVNRPKDAFDVTEDDWDRIHSIGARAAFFCMQRVARQMVDQGNGGSIINIASIAAKGFPMSSNAAYGASKGAMVAMSLTAAHALGQHSIRVNAICPGVVRTPMFYGLFSERSVERGVPFSELESQLNEMIPLRRFNEPADIAALAVLLAGTGGRNITGQSINVDGGLVMH